MFKTIQIFCVFILLNFSPVATAAEDAGMIAIARAEKAGKFLLACFFDTKGDSANTEAVKSSVKKAATELTEKVDAVFINTDNQNQQELVAKFRLRYAPKPLVLVMAPNGIIVGSFQKPFTVDLLKSGLPGPGMLECLKILQSGKIVVLCIQNKDSAECVAAMKGVDDFIADPQFGRFAVKVVINPATPEETGTLKQFRVSSSSEKAISLLLAPPGSIVGKWEGAVTKETMAKQLMLAMASSRSCGSKSCVDPSCPPTAKGGGK